MILNLIFSLNIITTLSIYDTQIIPDTIVITQRIGQSQILQLPFNFSTYRNIQLTQAYDPKNQLFSFSLCKITQPKISVTGIDQLYYQEWKEYTDVITTYQQILSQHSVLDMIIFKGLLYVVHSNGIFKRIQINNSSGNDSILRFSNSSSIDEIKNLTDGYFVIIKNNTKLLFINAQNAILVDADNIKIVKGYIMNQNFQSAQYVLDLDIIAIACGINGLALYRFIDENNSLIYLTCFNSVQFWKQKIDISDLACYKQKIYILNRIGGIHILNVNMTNLDSSVIMKTKYNIINCENLLIQNGTIYVTCPQIHQIQIQTQKQKIYPSYMRRIKNMLLYKSFLILVGSNLINIFYNSNLIGLQRQFDLDRLRVYQNKIYLAQETSLRVDQWQLSNPIILCGLKSKQYINFQGKYTTKLKVTAQCNPRYFTQLKLAFTPDLQNQICIYHFPLAINFWIGSQLNLLPFKIVGVVIVILLIIVFIGWIILKTQHNKLSNALLKYKSLDSGYNNMVEEKQHGKQQGIEMEFKQSSQQQAVQKKTLP